MTNLKQDHETVHTDCESYVINIGSRNCTLLLDKEGTSRAQNDSFEVFALGQPRRYGSSQSVTAGDLLQWLADGQAMQQLFDNLAGRFALLVVDKPKQSLSMLTDHMASLPLYYGLSGNQVGISSSLSQLIENGIIAANISRQAVFHYVYFHCIPAPLTIYANASKLCPAQWLEIDEKQVAERGNLYRPKFAQELEQQENMEAKCLQMIESAVKYSADAPDVGAFLSGGLDSSTVAGMLKKVKGAARTFSVGFNEPGYDETEFAMITARHFETEHKTSYLEPDYISENFAKVAERFEEPFGNSSALAAFYCASEAHKAGIRTMLAGDGGDEFFAGNSRYAKQKLFQPFENLPGALKTLMRGIFVKTPLAKIKGFSKVASYIRQADNPLPDRLQEYNFLHRFAAGEIFTKEFLEGVDKELPLQQLRQRYQQADSASPVDHMLYMDWKFTLADNDLVKVSKMCEMAGVDVRFPFLEKELVDFSCKIPAEVKLPGQKLRHFFKQATRQFLATETLNKPKHGFGLPFGRWMRSTPKLVDITQSSLENLKKRNIFKPEFIDKALAMQSQQHAAYYGELIWIMTVLELWLQSREE
ncbi:asparagine synthase-related protein [Aliiglaciecola sp. CAU 1673]|uniref:asparagine synthetase B family protein n=1 Tax=Aliiglaciecola sp. CAU 1673 TaxID=3032595 RepID=UPI0023DBEC55|nr:asparagine synthase-related protein [Aliiglaciecola sp. CAU 1673]MDF2177302.1 asparagine synthase-related protein [Aliiglaciecola sp. CAU 1673]